MKKFRSLSLSTQIFFLITSFILLLILLQYLVYTLVFQGFYLNSRLSNLDEELSTHVEELRKVDSGNYYQPIYTFTSQNTNTYSLVLNKNLTPIEEQYSSYSIELTDTTTYESYNIILADTTTTIKKSDRVTASWKQTRTNRSPTST